MFFKFGKLFSREPAGLVSVVTARCYAILLLSAAQTQATIILPTEVQKKQYSFIILH